ncbi:MAG: ABC-2 transporter permease [Oscillospiraceae bacterium]|nr:ABC-2 transporter permease [Oscillospiraceae bacterium]
MKALLYKDWLVMTKYARTILLLDLVFVAVGFFSPDTPFFTVFPLAMSAALITALISYDERFHFDRTCDAMPVSRRTQVSEKYLIGLCYTALLFVLCLLGALRHHRAGTPELYATVITMLCAGLLPMSLLLPVIFKLGSERGRLFYYVFYFGGLALAMVGADAAAEIRLNLGFPIVLLAAAVLLGIYALSWRLAVRFYAAREL